MPPKIIFLTGAPSADSLDWGNVVLLDGFLPEVANFLGLDIPSASIPPPSNEASWRLLPLKRYHLATGFTEVHEWHGEHRNAEFLNTQDLSFIASGSTQDPSEISTAQSLEDALSQFYEESFAIHQDIPSSALPISSQRSTQNSQGKDGSGAASFTTSSSSSAPYSSTALMPPPTIPRPEIPYGGHLSDLEDVPNANYLNSIQPQTVTVNLIVGIISIAPPRTIKTRRGADVEIVEILVGDETKSGFGVNFWLHPTDSDPSEANCRSVLENLRLQDIVLLRNVALSSFKGKVYGQSLRKDMTKIHLLYRNLLDSRDVGGCYGISDLTGGKSGNQQTEKTRLVREWVLRFLGGPVPQDSKGKRNQKAGKWEAAKEVLPPDTQ